MLKDIQYAELCEIGGRTENQDFLKSRIRREGNTSLYQFIVADGLGGQGGGKLASEAATLKVLVNQPSMQPDTVSLEEYFSVDRLALLFDVAHDHLRLLQRAAREELSRMATTMVILMIMDGKAIWGHVGDSRLYLFRQGKIHHQTKDHSILQMLLSSGEIKSSEMRQHPDRNSLLRAIGDTRSNAQAPVRGPEELLEGDVFLLCTDGFWEYVTEDEMIHALINTSSPEEWLTMMTENYLKSAVKKEAIQNGDEHNESNDNYTAIAVWYGGKSY